MMFDITTIEGIITLTNLRNTVKVIEDFQNKDLKNLYVVYIDYDNTVDRQTIKTTSYTAKIRTDTRYNPISSLDELTELLESNELIIDDRTDNRSVKYGSIREILTKCKIPTYFEANEFKGFPCYEIFIDGSALGAEGIKKAEVILTNALKKINPCYIADVTKLIGGGILK